MKKDFHSVSIADNTEEAYNSQNLFNFAIGSNGLYEIVKEENYSYTMKRMTNLPVSFKGEKPFSICGHNFMISKNGLRIHDGTSFVKQKKYPQISTKVDTFFKYNLPPIPYELCLKVKWFFKLIWKATKTEVMLEVYFNPETNSYFINCPKQTITKYRVTYHREEIPNMTKIMEIHSHHSMPAIFTTIDDADENKIGIIYGVIGNFKEDSSHWAMSLRVLNKGSFKYLDFTDIFESPKKLPIDELKKVFREEYKLWKEKLIVSR